MTATSLPCRSQRIRFRAYSHQSKVGAKVKKIKEQAKEINKQESIPVGCVPSAFLIPGWSAQLPLDADPLPPEADPPSPWKEWQTLLKILPCSKLRLVVVIEDKHQRELSLLLSLSTTVNGSLIFTLGSDIENNSLPHSPSQSVNEP